MNDWWKNNGSKINEKLDDMECHEYHDSTKLLIDINDKLSETLDLLKTRK